MIGTTNMDLTGGGGISRLYVWEKYTRKKEITRDKDHVCTLGEYASTNTVSYYSDYKISSAGDIIGVEGVTGGTSSLYATEAVDQDRIFTYGSDLCWGGYQDSDSNYYAYIPYAILSENPDTLLGYVVSLKKTDYPEDGYDGDFYYKIITSDKDIESSYYPKLIPIVNGLNGTINGYAYSYISSGKNITLNIEYSLKYVNNLGIRNGVSILIIYNQHIFLMNVTDVNASTSSITDVVGTAEVISYETSGSIKFNPDDADYYLIK